MSSMGESGAIQFMIPMIPMGMGMSTKILHTHTHEYVKLKNPLIWVYTHDMGMGNSIPIL